MEYPYSIDDLAVKSGITKQSAYAFIKKNKAFIDENSTRWHRQVKYSQAVLDLFLSYYQPDNKKESTDNSIESHEIKQVDNKSVCYQTEKAEDNTGVGEHQEKLDAASSEEVETLRKENEELKVQIEKLKADLAKSQEEKGELIKQNGMALLMLQQEKQEKQLLLPAPEQGWLGWLFGKKKKK